MSDVDIADDWNALNPVGTPVVAYPLSRDDAGLVTTTRSEAWTLGGHTPVVLVDGYAGGIALTHIDVTGERAETTEWLLTHDTYAEIDKTIDKAGVFAKDYTRYVDDKLTVVGMRIGEKPSHVVAFFGDTIIRHADGTYSVRRATEGGEVS